MRLIQLRLLALYRPVYFWLKILLVKYVLSDLYYLLMI